MFHFYHFIPFLKLKINSGATVLFTASKCCLVFVFVVFNVVFSSAQTVLNADGPGNTYELINSVLAPSGTAVEAPDQTTVSSGQIAGTHPDFGRHIAEVWDTDLNKYVFEFYSHLDSGATGVLDNDVSTTKTDRQRVEIKTYASSPSNLKGTLGETVTYKWRFKVPVGFLPTSNFSHLHQVKPVDGDDSNPIFTLTAIKGTPNKLEVDYVQSATSGTTKFANLDLSLFEGIWVEVTEVIKIGSTGTYSILIKRVDNGTVILSYANANLVTIRPDNSFIRPKWGIYRSIEYKAIMRDEAVRFSDLSIDEGTLSTSNFSTDTNIVLYPNPVQDIFNFSDEILTTYTHFSIYDSNGKLIHSQKITSARIDVSFLDFGIYYVKLSNKELVSKTVKILKQ